MKIFTTCLHLQGLCGGRELIIDSTTAWGAPHSSNVRSPLLPSPLSPSYSPLAACIGDDGASYHICIFFRSETNVFGVFEQESDSNVFFAKTERMARAGQSMKNSQLLATTPAVGG